MKFSGTRAPASRPVDDAEERADRHPSAKVRSEARPAYKRAFAAQWAINAGNPQAA
jgi:hypothetical protein